MLHTLENNFLRISISDMGAELCSIFDKENERDVLWHADPKFWGRHAPLLFPAVGSFYQHVYHLNGKEYAMKQHGFARDSEFVCTEETGASVTHQLRQSAETLEIWPFDFILTVTHELCGRELKISWRVENPGTETMYFTIGGHPAFNVPVLPGTEQNDYYLAFEEENRLSCTLLDLETGTTFSETEPLLLDHGKRQIDDHLFDGDTLIFDNGQVERAQILLPDGSPYVEVTAKGFPNFGIWSPKGAPFVCLEPWMGRCDSHGFTGDLSEKENINVTEPGGVFEKSYSIKVY